MNFLSSVILCIVFNFHVDVGFTWLAHLISVGMLVVDLALDMNDNSLKVLQEAWSLTY